MFPAFPTLLRPQSVSGRSLENLQGGYLWGQEWEGDSTFTDNFLVLTDIFNTCTYITLT